MRRKQHFLLLAVVFLVACWVSASCQKREDSCTADSDCELGGRYLCDPLSGVCVDCVEDEDCPAGHACLDTYCEPECSGTNDCTLGQTCKEGACAIGCTLDTDCPFPHVCRLGQCSIRFKCESDSDCRHGATCDLTDTPARCVNTACTSDAECAANQRCYTHDKCWPRICDTAADCPAAPGFGCIKNRCVCTGTCT
jgi:hypothetical protein